MARTELAIIVCGIAWGDKGLGFSSTAALKLQNQRKGQSRVRPKAMKKGAFEGLRRRPAIMAAETGSFSLAGRPRMGVSRDVLTSASRRPESLRACWRRC